MLQIKIQFQISAVHWTLCSFKSTEMFMYYPVFAFNHKNIEH